MKEEFVLVLIGGEPQNPADLPGYYTEFSQFMQFLNREKHFKAGIPVASKPGALVRPEGVDRDGEFMSAANRIAGVLSIEAKNIDDAIDIAKRCPTLTHGGKVVVRKVQPSN